MGLGLGLGLRHGHGRCGASGRRRRRRRSRVISAEVVLMMSRAWSLRHAARGRSCCPPSARSRRAARAASAVGRARSRTDAAAMDAAARRRALAAAAEAEVRQFRRPARGPTRRAGGDCRRAGRRRSAFCRRRRCSSCRRGRSKKTRRDGGRRTRVAAVAEGEGEVDDGGELLPPPAGGAETAPTAPAGTRGRVRWKMDTFSRRVPTPRHAFSPLRRRAPL